MTNRKRKNGRTKESQHPVMGIDWEPMVDVVSECITVTDVQYRVLRINKAMSAAIGIDQRLAAGTDCCRTVHGTESPPRYCPLSNRSGNAGGSFTGTVYNDRIGAACKVYVAPRYDGEGKLVGCIHVVRTVEEAAVSGETFERKYHFLEKVLQALDSPFYVVDVDDYSVILSNAAAGCSGGSDGKRCHELIHGRATPCKNACPIDAIKKTKLPVTVEHTHVDRHQDVRISEVHAYPLVEDDGSVNKMVVYTVDITDRKHAEEEREQLVLDHLDALSRIKTLSGLIPICASCKKIRDDNGYWDQVENYISEHSEAEFSHGICPDCATKIYPKYHQTNGDRKKLYPGPVR